MTRTVTRRDFIHQMSATLGVVAATYRSVGLVEGTMRPEVRGTAVTFCGDAFAANGELQILRRFALLAARDGARDDAFDHLLTAASLVDAPRQTYRETLAALRPLCVVCDRPRAATTIDWYLERDTLPDDPYDAASTRLARGEALAAAIGFDRLGLPAHAAFALERADRRGDARDRYLAVASTRDGLVRALAALAAARLSAPGDARDRTIAVATEHARRALDPTTPRGRDLADALRDRAPVDRPAADRFRFVAAPPLIEPMLDVEAPQVAQLAAPLLLSRARFEQRVSPSAADFALRRIMVTRLLALEVATATGERRELLAQSLALRVQQTGDERLDLAMAPRCVRSDRAVA